MTESTKSMTAEDAILSDNAGVRFVDDGGIEIHVLGQAVALYSDEVKELKKILLKTDRMAVVEKVKAWANFLEETRKIGRYPDKRSSDEVYDRIVEAIGKADAIWNELESKSEMRERGGE